MSLTPGQVWRGARAIGEDTTDIMEKLLGFPPDQVQDFYNRGVLHRTEPCAAPECEALQN